MSDFFKLRIRPWGLLTGVGFLGVIGSVAGFFGQFAWWLDIGSHFRVQYTALFALLALCYMVGKKPRWALACLAFCIVNAVPVAAYIFPARGYDTVTGLSLRVVLINVNTECGKPEEVVALLQRENPDIVILEEINDEWVRRLLPVLLAYPVRLLETRDDNFGIGLIARAEAISKRVVYFGSAEVPSIVATMKLGGRPFTIVATHPLPPGGKEYSRCRDEQLDCVAAYVGTNRGPLILFGDINVSPWSPRYREFIRKSGLINSSQGRSIDPTWPTFSPLFLIPIDHCLHTDAVAIKSKRIGRSIGSDHFPLIVEFALKDEGVER
jgi:endonuclease/exonuclease/phosphatase (EEP) superfamily protein YafD